MINYKWNEKGQFWSHIIAPDTDIFGDLDIPKPIDHSTFDSQQRDIFAVLLSGIEPGTPQHLAYLITYKRYGYYHEGYCNFKWPKENNDE